MTLLILLACDADPVTTSITDNPSVVVAELFTHDGCTVYRFADGGRSHYFARCASGAATVSPQNCGKSCVRDEEIQTVTEEQP